MRVVHRLNTLSAVTKANDLCSTTTLETMDEGAGIVAVRAGHLACQRDSTLRCCTSIVITCVPAPSPAAATVVGTGKKAKKKGSSSSGEVSEQSGAGGDSADGQLAGAWLVTLSDTVLFPEGGGQPADHGMVGGVPCDDVQVDPLTGVPLHRVSAPLEVGAEVEVSSLSLADSDCVFRWSRSTANVLTAQLEA